MDSSRRGNGVSIERPPVLCVYGSPRAGGNTDLLLDRFAQAVTASGWPVERVILRELSIHPCREIYACRTGGCALQDDMTPLYDRIRDAGAIALASPIMFYGVSALAKAFIDRCQALWSLRYLQKRPVNRVAGGPKPAVFLSVGATRGKRLFEGALLTFRYVCDAIEAEPWAHLTVPGVDGKAEILDHPEALAEAGALGARLAALLGERHG